MYSNSSVVTKLGFNIAFLANVRLICSSDRNDRSTELMEVLYLITSAKTITRSGNFHLVSLSAACNLLVLLLIIPIVLLYLVTIL